MNVKTGQMRVFTKVAEKPKTRSFPSPPRGTRNIIVEEWQEKQYMFLDYSVSYMFDRLLKLKLIELLEMKHPNNEPSRVDNLNYCQYHRLLGHSIEKCFISKDRVMTLA